MSTTVTYKGNTLATVSNNTKTLKTAGKYMEGDVVLTDVSQSAPTIQSLSVTPSETAQTFNASGVDGYKPVSVDAIPTISTYTISTVNGTFYTEGGLRRYRETPSFTSSQTGYLKVTAYSSLTGNYKVFSAIASNTTITPTESVQTIGGATVILEGAITVSAIPSDYIGSGIIQRDSTDLTVSDATVSVPAGYYSAAASKSVASGNATAPASISGMAASVSTGNGTLTLTKTVSVTPSVTAGYISSGTAGNSSVSLTASITIDPTPTASGATVTIPAGYYSAQTTKSVTTMTLPTSASSSATSGYTKKATISRSTSAQYINIAPGYNSAGGYYEISAVANGSAKGPSSLSGSSATVSTGTNTLTLTKTGVTTTPTVTAGYVSSATASTATVTLTASVTTKAAATITPTTTNQTIAAGTYLTGTQTIAGDADLVGSNILSTANIFGVQGTVDFIDVYIRSAAPTSSVGNDGDIYIQE